MSAKIEKEVFMPLQSQLLRGDSKLEAAAVSDPAHIFLGAAGEHVRKIQLALIQLDGAAIDPDGKYGPATAAAVLAYKQKRDIVNRSFETEADNIVGKMTMASLDRELLAKEKEIVPFRPARFIRANPGDQSDGFSEGSPGLSEPVTTRGLVSFGVAGAPPNPTRFFTSSQILVEGDQIAVALLGGKGATLSTEKEERVDESVAITRPRPPDLVPNNGALIILRGVRPGLSHVIASDSSGRVIARLRVLTVTKITKSVSFTFLTDRLGGRSGVATARLPGAERAIMDEVSLLYNRQTGIFFTFSNRSLHIKEFDSNFISIDLNSKVKRFGEWTKIFPVHRVHSADFNVVFCKAISDKAGFFVFNGGITEIVADAGDFRDTVMDDRVLASLLVQSDGTNCAHELGHALGEGHQTAPPFLQTSLMSANNAVGREIDFNMAIRMRKNLQDFPQK